MMLLAKTAAALGVGVSLFFGQFAAALVTGPNLVIGVVKSVTDKAVIVVKDDKRIEVPREFVPEKTVKVGEKIEVAIPHDQLSAVKVTTEKK